MRRPVLLALSIAGLAVIWAGAASLYSVGEAQQAVVVRSGAPLRVVNAGGASSGAGLYAHWPFVEHVVTFDRRVQVVQGDVAEMSTTIGGMRTIASTLSYRVTDPQQAYLHSGGSPVAERLQGLLAASVRQALQTVRPTDATTESWARAARVAARRAASADQLGIQILDLRLTDAVPPPSEAQEIASRMQAGETGQVDQIRVQGEAQKREKAAEADREALDIRAEGERQALEVRGDGDAQRAGILGAAYGQDLEFARFFRRLEAYDQALNPDNTTLVLSSENAFMDLFGRGPGGAPKSR